MVVPEQALVPQGTEQYVFKIVDNKAVRVKVETGQRRDGKVEVIAGLVPGDLIVTAGQLKIRDGSTVTVLGRQDDKSGRAPVSSASPTMPGRRRSRRPTPQRRCFLLLIGSLRCSRMAMRSSALRLRSAARAASSSRSASSGSIHAFTSRRASVLVAMSKAYPRDKIIPLSLIFSEPCIRRSHRRFRSSSGSSWTATTKPLWGDLRDATMTRSSSGRQDGRSGRVQSGRRGPRARGHVPLRVTLRDAETTVCGSNNVD